MAMFRTFLFVSLLAPGAGNAGEWSARVAEWQTSTLTATGIAADEVERSAYHLRWRAAGADNIITVAYAHEPVLVRTGRPATNGYLHRLETGWKTDLGPLRADLGVGLHGSSNIFRHTIFHEDVLSGRFHLQYPLAGTAIDGVGLAGDHAFGEFLLYPTLARRFRLAGRTLAIELPTAIRWGNTGDPWYVTLHRYGRKWGTLDRDETVEGRLYLTEWRFETSTRLSPGDNGVSIRAGGGLSFDTRIRYLDLDRGFIEARQEPAAYVFVSGRW